MTAELAIIAKAIGGNFGRWLAVVGGFVVSFYLVQLAGAVISVGTLPNFVTFYNWPGNVLRILASTPSLTDALAIVADEWLIEIGYKNRDFGPGIAVWSLAVVPAKLALIAALGALVGTCFALLRTLRAGGGAHAGETSAGAAAAGLGVCCAGIANVTLSWVACCATPTWVVGLALLGVGAGTAFALIPYGNMLIGAGFAILLATVWALARRCTGRQNPETLSAPPRFAVLDR